MVKGDHSKQQQKKSVHIRMITFKCCGHLKNLLKIRLQNYVKENVRKRRQFFFLSFHLFLLVLVDLILTF